MRTSLLAIASLLSFFSAYANTITAVTSSLVPGEWAAGSTWSSGTVPQNGDLVVIPFGNAVQVGSQVYPSSTPNLSIEVFGTLNFKPSGKLDLGSTSYIQIFLLGKIIPQNTSSSQLITIGGVTKYNAANNGIVLGPAYANALSGTSTPGFPLSGFDVGVLPIKLSLFTAKEMNGSIELIWKTLEELNTNYFEIEKSTSNGQTWQLLSKVFANGAASSYSVIDRTPSKGSIVYRLKSVDKDGRSSYSSIVKIDRAGSISLFVSPNPAKSNITISLSAQAEGQHSIHLINMFGQAVKKIACEQGKNIYQLDVQSLPRGTYVVAVNQGLQQIRKETVLIQ